MSGCNFYACIDMALALLLWVGTLYVVLLMLVACAGSLAGIYNALHDYFVDWWRRG